MTGAVTWSIVLILLLTLVIARSTATAAWVSGIDVVTVVALGGACLMGVLAVAPVPWSAGLGVGLVAGPVVAAIAAWPVLHAAHPLDTVSISLITTWWRRIADGSASADPAFYLHLICLLMWVTGGWLSWCVLRWRRPMLGLVPGAAAFATNLLNYPADQNGYTLGVLVLTLALLLWTNYTASIASATRARVRLTGDARWDFWESGLVAMAGLIVLAIMLPPLSTVDQTVEMESSIFSSWAQLQQRLSHPTVLGNGSSVPGTTGFSTVVALNGELKTSPNVVFTYTFSGSSGPQYFRGLNETQTMGGEWLPSGPNNVQSQFQIPSNTIPPYGEEDQQLALTAFSINMISPPIDNTNLLFYPGVLYTTDRKTVATEVQNLPFNPSLTTIDRLSSLSPPVSTGTYNITVEYSTATEAELQQAGTAYPAWLASYASLPTSGYRSTQVLKQIHQLALKVTAGALTPYDKAMAVETYLRSGNFTYTLTPPATPPGVDPLAYFLFTSQKGYCAFFASAMGDMLRSLGIPTRLVNGFGPGQYNATIHRWVVRDEDAHTWVESYFPGYGWITFEPTADGVYGSIPRGSTGTNPCTSDTTCATQPSPNPSGLPGPGLRPVGPGGSQPNASTGGGSGFSLRFPDAGTLTKIIGVLLAVLLVLAAAGARYLRPRSVMMVWKRTLVLARLAGAERRTGETPLELARRLSRTFPEASEPVRSLADGFVLSAYAPPKLAENARESVMDAWAALRPMLLRRVAARLRPNRA
jgi:transglutaminase-like putative cysteine protease